MRWHGGHARPAMRWGGRQAGGVLVRLGEAGSLYLPAVPLPVWPRAVCLLLLQRGLSREGQTLMTHQEAMPAQPLSSPGPRP